MDVQLAYGFKDIYHLVKLLGADKPLYVDHSPMYNNTKGASRLSDLKILKTLIWVKPCQLVVRLKRN